jgi:hypothetical protein
MSEHGQGTTALRAYLPDQYRVKLKSLIATFCIGWKSDNEDEAQGKIWEAERRNK